MTDQEHVERIRECAEKLNGALLDAQIDGLRVDCEEENKWYSETGTLSANCDTGMDNTGKRRMLTSGVKVLVERPAVNWAIER